MNHNSLLIFVKKYWKQMITVFIGTLDVISDGMQFSWTAPTIPILKSNETTIKISSSDEMWLENIPNLGGLFGLVIASTLISKLGKKSTMLIICFLNAIVWFLISIATKITLIFFARFILGFAATVNSVVTPMYIAEIADKEVRGYLGTFFYIMFMFGVLLLYSVAPYTTITNTAYVGLSITVTQFVLFSFMPETPYFYLIKKENSKALKSLQCLRNKIDVFTEFDEITKAVERQQSEKGRFIDLFINKSNFKAVIIMFVLNAFINYGFIGILLMNMHTILEDSETFISNKMACIIVAAVMLFACISASFVMDIVGRKKMLIISSLSAGICLTLLATYFLYKEFDKSLSVTYNWIPFTIVIIYSYIFRLGAEPLIMIAELFPTNIKNKALSLGEFFYLISAFILIYIYEFMKNKFGIFAPMYFFASLCFPTVPFLIFYLPETKGKSLEEIQMILKGIKD